MYEESSTDAMAGGPTLAGVLSHQNWMQLTAHVSVSPYPCRRGTPSTVWKKHIRSRDSGAEPCGGTSDGKWRGKLPTATGKCYEKIKTFDEQLSLEVLPPHDLAMATADCGTRLK